MRKNQKKGQVDIKAVIYILVAIVFFVVAFAPTYSDSVDSSKTFSCEDAVLDTLNWSTDPPVCFNGTHMSVTASPTRTGTTAVQEAVLLLGITFSLLGVVSLVVNKLGII